MDCILVRSNRKNDVNQTLQNGLHLKTGDTMPPYNGGLRLFGMRFCQYVQRSMIVLRAKKIPYEIVYINLKHKPEWLFDFSPKGTVPILEFGRNKAIFDSTIINVYLDEEYPKPKLQSTEPARRAQDKVLLENFTPVQQIYYTAGFNPAAVESAHVEIYHKGLQHLQKELDTRGTKYLHGNEPGLIDYTIWPFLERFEALPLLGCKNEQFVLNEPTYKRLLSYMEVMKRDPAVKFTYLAPQIHARYLATRIRGEPDFNMDVSSLPVGEGLEFVLPVYRNMSTKKINVNTRHLKKGDPLPPYNGKLRVYNSRYCPFAQRTILALNAKGLDYEVVNINLKDKPDWLVAKSALSKVPALEIEENVSIYESLVTVEYLEDAYPQRPLFPKDLVKKAFDKIIIEVCAPIVSLFIKVVKSPNMITEENIINYNKTFEFLEDQLKGRGTKFLDGEEPGYGDYMIWPFIERIWFLQDFDKRLQFDTQKHARFVQYINDMLKDPAVVPYLIPKECLVKLMQDYQNNRDPNFDMLLEE